MFCILFFEKKFNLLIHAPFLVLTRVHASRTLHTHALPAGWGLTV